MKPQDWFGLLVRCLGLLIFLNGLYWLANIWLLSRSVSFGAGAGPSLYGFGALVLGHFMLRRADAIVRYTYRD